MGRIVLFIVVCRFVEDVGSCGRCEERLAGSSGCSLEGTFSGEEWGTVVGIEDHAPIGVDEVGIFSAISLPIDSVLDEDNSSSERSGPVDMRPKKGFD